MAALEAVPYTLDDFDDIENPDDVPGTFLPYTGPEKELVRLYLPPKGGGNTRIQEALEKEQMAAEDKPTPEEREEMERIEMAKHDKTEELE